MCRRLGSGSLRRHRSRRSSPAFWPWTSRDFPTRRPLMRTFAHWCRYAPQEQNMKYIGYATKDHGMMFTKCQKHIKAKWFARWLGVLALAYYRLVAKPEGIFSHPRKWFATWHASGLKRRRYTDHRLMLFGHCWTTQVCWDPDHVSSSLVGSTSFAVVKD